MLQERLRELKQFIELGQGLQGTLAEFHRLFTLTEGSTGEVICIQLNGTHPPRQIAAVGVQQDGTFSFYDCRFTKIPGGVCENPLTASEMLNRLDSVQLYVVAQAAATAANSIERAPMVAA